MSSHDEEYPAQPDAQELGASTERAEDDPAAQEPPPGESLNAESVASAADQSFVSLTSQVEATLGSIRRTLEEKNWSALKGLFGLDSIFIDGHPESTDTLIATLYAVTENLCDFEATLLRVDKNEVTSDRGRFSLRLRIMWNSCEDWEDHDLYLSVHAGYELAGESWKLAYLSLSRVAVPAEPSISAPAAAPVPVPSPAPAKTSPPPAPASPVAHTTGQAAPAKETPRRLTRPVMRGKARSLASLASTESNPPAKPKQPDQPLSEDYFTQAAAQYFAQVGSPEKGELMGAKPAMLGSSIGGRHHLLYVPVVMHEDLLKKILSSE